MALTITVTPGAISSMGGNVYDVTANLNCVDGANGTVINEDVTVKVTSLVNTETAIAAIAQPELKVRMQAMINDYKNGSPSFPGTQATTIQSGLAG